MVKMSKIFPKILRRNIANIFWSRDSKKIFIKYDDYGMTKLGYLNLSGDFIFLVNEVGGLSQGRPYSGGTFRYQEMTDMLSLLVMFITPLILQLEVVVQSKD